MRNQGSNIRDTGTDRGARTRRRGRRALALAAAGVLGSTLLTACAGADSSTTVNGVTTITIGVGGNIFDLPARLADANGYFTKEGLKVNYVTLTSATGTAALQSGSVQFLTDSPNDILTALGKNIPETAISLVGSGNPLGLVVSTKFAKAHGLTSSSSAAKVAAALAGSTAGASSPNTKAEAGIFLKAYGVDPTKLSWVSLPSPTADKAALASNEIDWFVTSEPIPLEMQYSGDGIVVADPLSVPAWSAAESGYGLVVVASNSYLDQHADVAKKFAAAIQDATGYLSTHLTSSTDSTVLSVAEKTLPNIPASVLQNSLAQVVWPTSGAMSAADWTKTQAFLDSLGTLPSGDKISSKNWTNTYLS